MFIGRKRELKAFDSLYVNPTFQMIVLYGRRRVGKTFLIKEWLKNRKGVYFAFELQNSQVLLNKFSEVILSEFPSDYITSFQSFEQCLRYLGEQSKTVPVILALDEVQYIALQDKGFLSMLQNMIDHYLLQGQLKLILAGSYMSFMENEVLGHKSPVYGRRTASFKLLPFRYNEARELLQGNEEDNFKAWAILGGMPLYLKQFERNKSFEENLRDKILTKGTLLHDEPLYALKQELKEPAVYLSIVEAISSGRSKYNEITTYIGTDAGYYLNNLVELGIIEKHNPIGEKKTSRKSLYHVSDPYFSFWFRYVSQYYSLIEMEKQEVIINQKILPELSMFLGKRFEQFCVEYLHEMNGTSELPILFTEVGGWWGTNPKTKQQEEIDIVAVENKDKAIFCECKWRNEKTDVGVIETLVERSKLLPYQEKYYIVFSKSEFTEGAQVYAKSHSIKLVLFNEI